MKELEIRKNLKKKKPFFVRQDYYKKKRLGIKWRKPKGLHSKMRLSRKGYRKTVKVSYGSPKVVRGYDKKGFMRKIVNSFNDLESIDSKKHGAIIGSNVGMRKKILLLKKAKELKITVLNIKDVDAFLKKTEEMLKKKAEEKKKLEMEKKEKLKEKEKKSKEKEKEKKDKVDEEDQKEKEKKELDKMLTKKD